MTTQEVLGIVKERGMKIIIKDGKPMISKPPENHELTDTLLKVLAIHRERIVAILNEETQCQNQ